MDSKNDHDNFLNIYKNHALKRLVVITAAFGGLALADKRVNTTTGNVVDRTSVKIPANLQVPTKWQSLINPETDEFWHEGNFTPDAGFVLWAKNPTIENAKLYLIRMNAKRDRLHTMQQQQEQANKELIMLGVIANDYDFLAGATRSEPKITLSFTKDTQIFFFFNPTCPHCTKQGEILAGQSNVTPMQIGGKELIHFQNLSRSVWATKEDVDRYASEKMVPVLLVYNRKTNNITSLKGVHSLQEIDKVAKRLKEEVSK